VLLKLRTPLSRFGTPTGKGPGIFSRLALWMNQFRHAT